MRSTLVVLLGLAFQSIAACGVEKTPQAGLDYGEEDSPAALEGKDDSATRPASMVSIDFGETKPLTFTRAAKWRAFKFAAKRGDAIEVYLDGLAGLDTVVHLYKISRTTGRPYGRALASNDDTEQPGWQLESNHKPNHYSSSITSFALTTDGDFAIVATTYEQSFVGKAEVQVTQRREIRIVSDGSWKAASQGATGWSRASFEDDAWEATASPGPEDCGGPQEFPETKTMWTAAQGRYAYLRKTFVLPSGASVKSARIKTVADDDHDVWVNGTKVVSDHDLASGPIVSTDIREYLVPGKNVIAIRADDSVGGGCRWVVVDGVISLN